LLHNDEDIVCNIKKLLNVDWNFKKKIQFSNRFFIQSKSLFH
jgi:hypothetical protein